MSDNQHYLFSFEITANNMKDLAQLSDKYIIEVLRNDIRVSIPSSGNSYTQNYTRLWVLSHEQATMDLWEFAARYSFEEMETYCRKALSDAIDSMLGDQSKGIQYLVIDRGLSLSFVSQLVLDLAKRAQRRKQQGQLLRHYMEERGRNDHLYEYLQKADQGFFDDMKALDLQSCGACAVAQL